MFFGSWFILGRIVCSMDSELKRCCLFQGSLTSLPLQKCNSLLVWLTETLVNRGSSVFNIQNMSFCKYLKNNLDKTPNRTKLSFWPEKLVSVRHLMKILLLYFQSLQMNLIYMSNDTDSILPEKYFYIMFSEKYHQPNFSEMKCICFLIVCPKYFSIRYILQTDCKILKVWRYLKVKISLHSWKSLFKKIWWSIYIRL